MTASTTDVAIIGGGAAGCAVAYYLAEAGVKSTIIEREGVGSQASGFAAGGLNPLQGAGIPGPLGAFAWESFRMHHGLATELRERTGIDYEFRTVSAVHLALEEDELPGLRETVDLFTAAEGFEAGFFDPKHIAEFEPRITPNFIRGVHEYGNAALDSLDFTRALAAAAESGGASVRPGTVCRIHVDGNAALRVSLEDGVIECGRVVLALGPWSRRAEAWLDAYIPVDPLKGEILRLDTANRPLNCDVSGGGGSIYNKPDLAWCGTEEWRGFDRQPLGRAGNPAENNPHRPRTGRSEARQTHRLPASGDPRLAPHPGPPARLRQRLPGHRRGQKGHPAGPGHRQVRRRPDYQRRARLSTVAAERAENAGDLPSFPLLAETEQEIPAVRIIRIVPGLAEAKLAKHTACLLRPVTPD